MADPITSLSVIIATMASAQRQQTLFSAIESVRNQPGLDVELIVVVNGSKVEPDVLVKLQADSGIKLIRQDEGSLPLALRTGRESISKPYFAFLDDDDEFLPNTLAHRATLLRNQPRVDLVVSNGYYVSLTGARNTYLTQFDDAKADPLESLARFNWLASCGGIYRAETVTSDYFDGKTKYFEWTLLSIKLALDKRIHFDAAPAYLIHQSPVSLSQSDAYLRAEVDFLRNVLTMSLPHALHQSMRVKLGRACHNRSDYLREAGNRMEALKFHLLSLKQPGGWKYIPYTRRIFF